MIKPCNKPLKNNPFTSYRDPDTGRWIVVTQVENPCESDPMLKDNLETAEKVKAEPNSAPDSATSPPVSRAPKFTSFCLPSTKLLKKSAVAFNR